MGLLDPHHQSDLLHPYKVSSTEMAQRLLNGEGRRDGSSTARDGAIVAAEILGDPYSKKSPLPSIDTSPRLAISPRIPVNNYLASQEYITDTTHTTITLEY
jgi:hypothetical protein